MGVVSVRRESLVEGDVEVGARQSPQALSCNATHHHGWGLEEQIPRQAMVEGDAVRDVVYVDGVVAEGGLDGGPERLREEGLEEFEAPMDHEADGAVVCVCKYHMYIESEAASESEVESESVDE